MSLVKDAIMDQKIEFSCIVIGIVALAATLLAEEAWPLVFVPIAICGLPIIWGAIVGVVKEHDITADVLVSVAIVASVIIGEYDAAADVQNYSGETELIMRNDPGASVSIFFPEDGHQPYIAEKSPEPIKKVVIRIML